MNKIKDIFDYIYYERSKILIMAVILLIVIPYFLFMRSEDVVIEDDLIKEEALEVKELKTDQVTIDIKGEVNSPGCYKIDSDKRVIDVIELAGGLKETASTDDINLSSKVYDEMVIVIKKKEEVSAVIESSNKSTITSSQTINKPSGKVSINTAGIDELITLNGIKEARAKKIIEYRESNGPFKSIEEIKNVSGIGEGIFAKIKDYITL